MGGLVQSALSHRHVRVHEEMGVASNLHTFWRINVCCIVAFAVRVRCCF